MDIPDLTSSAFSLLQPTTLEVESAPANSTPNYQLQGMEALPCEILERITELLSPHAVMSLRQASRSLALKVPLDGRFWRRHLCSGSLLPYLWDLDEEQLKQLLQHTPTELPRDWRGLARLFRTEECLKWGQEPLSGEIPGGLWNRCRIWSIIEEACVRPNTGVRSPIATPYRRTESRAPKGEYVRALSFGILVILITLVVTRDLQSLGLP